MSRPRMMAVGALLAAALIALPVTSTAREFASQSNHQFGVTARIRPVDIAAGAKAWTFEVALDTHSQNLADDFTRSAVLVDGTGKAHAPLAWDGAPPGGHHRKGLLRFSAISPMPAVLELRLQRPGEAAPRSYRWAVN